MDLRSTQLKDTYGNLVTTGTTAGSPTSGGLQNGQGTLLTSVGIGTNTPSYALDVNSGGANVVANFASADAFAQIYLSDNSTTDAEVIRRAGDVTTLYSGGNNALTIDSSGNVGIGATNIYADGLSIGSTDDNSFISSGGENHHLTLASVGSGGVLRFFTQGGTNGNRATTESMRIDTSGLIDVKKQIDSATLPNTPSNHALTFYPPINTGRFGGGISWSEGTNTAASINAIDGGSGGALGLVFSTGNNTTISRAMTIDSSGNVLVGKTSTNPNTEGVQIYPNGLLAISQDGGRPLYINRNTSDGELVEFKKDGTTVGSIGSISSDLYIAESSAGLRFDGENNQILPSSTTASTDNTCNLGASSARFKDLYLGGNVILSSGAGIDFSATADGSGTMTSELLDDYEEGTWTPSFAFDVGGTGVVYGTRSGNYTKVGNLVYVSFILTVSSGLSTSDYFLRLSGIPFNGTDAGQTIGRVFIQNPNNATFNLSVEGGGTSFLCYATNGATDFARGDDVNGVAISGAFTYRAS